MYIYLYIHTYRYDSNQEIDLRLENVISPLGHTRGSFSYRMELVL